ncbi:MAG: hypothetical protein EBU40_04380 [Proteobacteria bacterium]|nr:hypothetical protein [Pseudomonadota bacterium]NBQ61502.1 hypothetical protein [Pseudomonadota bacterium]NCV01768.1 hypothetical protein [Pseudomonadota bacterium]
MEETGRTDVHSREAWTNWYLAWTSWQIASDGQHSWADLARADTEFQRAWRDWQRASGGMPEFSSYLLALDQWERVAPREPVETGSASD